MQSIFLSASVISGFLPVFAFAYNYRDLDGIMKILGIFFIISLVFDFLEIVLTSWGVKNDMPLIHLFIIISILFLEDFIIWLFLITY